MTILDDALSLFGLKIEQRRNSLQHGRAHRDHIETLADVATSANLAHWRRG